MDDHKDFTPTEIANQGGKSFSCEPNGISAFEGPEKLLEIWFKAKPGREGDAKDLKMVEREVWETVLDKVHCCILSSITNEHVHAYLLSESSFFVWRDRLVLKTCGTTTLLESIPLLIKIAEGCGLTEVEDIFYSRQNFFFPDKQLQPHNSFVNEVRFLDSLFEHGAAYTIGRRNGDHYNFYNAEQRLFPPEPDSTLEIMMSELDIELMRRHFYADTFTKNTTKESGIADLLPGATIDDFGFEPFGYSMNAILGETYLTIHVSPQEGCSYASVETNVIEKDYTDLVQQVLKIFNPSKFMIVTCANNQESNNTGSLLNTQLIKELSYVVGERANYFFQHYILNFHSFCRAGHPLLSPTRGLRPVRKNSLR